MIQYLLATNMCIELIRQRSTRILDRLRQCDMGQVGISVITLAELEYGVEKSSRREQNRIALGLFCAPLEILPFTDHAAVEYGILHNTLERRGEVIGPMDLLIAAHALTDQATLVTSNEREFRRVEGLSVENWR